MAATILAPSDNSPSSLSFILLPFDALPCIPVVALVVILGVSFIFSKNNIVAPSQIEFSHSPTSVFAPFAPGNKTKPYATCTPHQMAAAASHPRPPSVLAGPALQFPVQ
ncbi:hypothetical protein I306_03241 [Cryptococcus gattii EJB2]|uniref:Uncharacterized protein n=1 Tax=Cryptococcus gattii EJB2 TaxID=1296103 RepID=A0ABR5BVU7_9TREE|nr:hypothetical protein I306_03241 [Cryptococcus gattii EJB2]KJE02793.1 hypothetical protein I311_03537 [Cryptococcus gattii NT-10]